MFPQVKQWQIRERADLSQRELAERAGCHLMTIAKLERGVQEPAWPLVLKLADVLGVECTAFIASDAAHSAEKRGHGRPPKGRVEAEGPAPKRPRGRPKKD
jgi:transcriptional regulator with XRE-family HTH domain